MLGRQFLMGDNSVYAGIRNRHLQIDYADSVSLKPDTRGILRVNLCCTLNLLLRIVCFYELLLVTNIAIYGLSPHGSKYVSWIISISPNLSLSNLIKFFKMANRFFTLFFGVIDSVLFETESELVSLIFFGFKGFIGCFEAPSNHLNFSFVISLHCHNIN